MRPKYNHRDYKLVKDSRQGRPWIWTIGTFVGLHKNLRHQSKKVTEWDYLKPKPNLYSKGKK